MLHDEQREKDIQSVCRSVISASIVSANDAGSWCPFCLHECRWDAKDVSVIEHTNDCIVLTAKDLLTNNI